jgi:anti-sigma factor RsiW
LRRYHPTEEILEEYVFGRLAEPQIQALEGHLLVCCACQDALAEADDTIAAFKAGLAQIRSSNPAARIPSMIRARIVLTSSADKVRSGAPTLSR